MESNSFQVSFAIHSDLLEVQEERLTEVVRRIAADFGYLEVEVSIAILDDSEIRELNREHLDHDWETDVISFLFESQDRLEGEIVASAETAKRESEQHPWSGPDELLLYVIHGMLHLVGLDDLDPDSAEEMRQQERFYLVQFGVLGGEGHGFEFQPHA